MAELFRYLADQGISLGQFDRIMKKLVAHPLVRLD